MAKHKSMVGAGAAAVVVLVGLIAWRASATPSAPAAAAEAQDFYSVDDGATYFTAPVDLVPPFDWKGKQAVRAAVFTCDGGATRFVGYLERYTPAAKKQVETARQRLKAGAKDSGPPTMALGGVEVRKPGKEGAWTSRMTPAAGQILQVKCPGGRSGTPEPVTP